MFIVEDAWPETTGYFLFYLLKSQKNSCKVATYADYVIVIQSQEIKKKSRAVFDKETDFNKMVLFSGGSLNTGRERLIEKIKGSRPPSGPLQGAQSGSTKQAVTGPGKNV